MIAFTQAGSHQRRRLIDPPPDAGDDAVDNLHQVLIVLERKAGEFQLAGAFHIHPVKTVYQDVGNGVVLEQRLERTKAEDFIQNFAAQTLAFGETERNGLAVYGITNQDQNFIAGCIADAPA